jgi:tetratricopeptide (TPR) repeat protein
VVGDFDHGVAFIDRALLLNTTLAVVWSWSGWARIYLGEYKVALEHFAHSMRLSPLDPFVSAAQAGIALAHLCAGRYDEASDRADLGYSMTSSARPSRVGGTVRQPTGHRSPATT